MNNRELVKVSDDELYRRMIYFSTNYPDYKITFIVCRYPHITSIFEKTNIRFKTCGRHVYDHNGRYVFEKIITLNPNATNTDIISVRETIQYETLQIKNIIKNYDDVVSLIFYKLPESLKITNKIKFIKT